MLCALPYRANPFDVIVRETCKGKASELRVQYDSMFIGVKLEVEEGRKADAGRDRNVDLV